MPRKTMTETNAVGAPRVASMRPRPDAAENGGFLEATGAADT